jgi:asparagine synthase (glutamine-hydrolysing)
MCGIAGIFHRDREASVDAGQLQRMVAVLRHRGPDDEALYVDGPVGLAVRRLEIVDPLGGKQPLFNEDGSVAVVFNGEIYNFRDLRRDLEANGHRFRTQSDTEVIVHAYEQYGHECVGHLRGMFAFAVWDGGRKELFVARDRFGIKPLYYAWDGRTFLFGSEIKAILQDASVRREIDALALDDFFTFNYIPAPRSIFSSIRKLRPAHTLCVSSSGLTEREYWDLAFEPDESADEEDCVDGLRHHLEEAVRLHVPSDVPMGVFLSGGMDSSAVTAVAAALVDRPIDTISIGFDAADFNELPYARAVARRCATRAREHILQPEAARIIDTLPWYYDEPFADSSMVPTYHIAQLARERATVYLAGDGGDEIFAGYTRFFAFQKHASRDAAAAEREYFRQRTWTTPAMKDRLYGTWLRRATRDYDPFSVLRTYFDRARQWDPVSRIQYVEAKTYMTGDLLTKVDRAGMAHGLEVRVPLLDHHLVEYAAGIPARYKLRDGVGKYVFKQALRDCLPAEILARPKMGFSMPLALWFRGPLKAFFEERVFARAAFLPEICDLQPVRACWAEHQSGQDHNRFLWSLLVLECWGQQFLAGRHAT